MANRQYIGARYVPKIIGEWTADTSYEALSVVTYQYASYTSKKPVPHTVGNPADNPEYWACTAEYNAQVAQYAEQVSQYAGQVADYKEDVDDLAASILGMGGVILPDLASLVAYDAKANDIITIAGHHTAGDGGHASYLIVNTAPATKYETLTNGKFAKLLYKDEINVKQFGAYGDGVHDDAQAFIDALSEVPEGIIVKVPIGLYTVGSAIEVSDLRNIKFVGENPSNPASYSAASRLNVEIKATESMAAIFKATRLNDFLIEGIYFNGDSKAANCITVNSSYNSIYRNLVCKNATHYGMELLKINDGIYYNTFDYCNFSYNGKAGLHVNQSNDSKINDCIFGWNGSNASGDAGLILDNCGTTTITKNRFEQNYGHGFVYLDSKASGTIGVRIIGNIFDGNDGTGLTTNNLLRSSITANHFMSNGTVGADDTTNSNVKLVGANNVSFTANSIIYGTSDRVQTNKPSYGLFLDGTRNTAVCGNTVFDSGTSANIHFNGEKARLKLVGNPGYTHIVEGYNSSGIVDFQSTDT